MNKGSVAELPQLLFSLLISYPLGSVFVRLPSSRPYLAHLFSICLSTFFLGPLLGMWTGMLHLACSFLGTYFLVTFSKGPRVPWVVFA